MDNYDFGFLIEQNFFTYLILLLGVSFIYFLIFRKVILSIIDPFFVYILSTVFAISDVIFLYITHSIKAYYFLSFSLSQISLLLGFQFFRKFKERKIIIFSKKLIPSNSYRSSNWMILIFMFSIFFIIQNWVYIQNGIPLFYESRLDYYSGGGGFGLVARVLGVLSMFVCFLFVKILLDNNFQLSPWKWIIILPIILFYVITQVFSGGKSSILIPINVFFSYLYINGNISILRKWTKKYILIICILLFLLVSVIIQLQSSGEDGTSNVFFPLLALFYRFIVSGDIFWYTYPNDVIRTYHITSNGFSWFFNDILGLFRIVSWKGFGEHPGVYFYNYHHYSDVTKGPNMRHNVFGLLFFKFYGGIIYSFFLGVLLSFFRFFLPSLKIDNIFLKFIILYLFINCVALEPDATIFMLSLDNLLLVFPCIWMVSLLILYCLNNKWNQKLIYQ